LLIIVSGRKLKLNPIDDELDECFRNLYSAWLGTGSLNYNHFRMCAKKFFNTNPNDWSKHNSYFENFTIIWHVLLNEGKHAAAQELWKLSMEPVFEWENDNKPNQIHKGTAYYFFGVSSILQGEIDKGYSLMHQALEEDVRINNTALPQTPAFFFVSLNDQKVEQYFRGWLIYQIEFLNRYITKYKTKYKSKLDLELFRKNYLENPPNRNLLFLFSYTLTRFYMFHDIPEYAIKNNFSGQIELNLLFDMTLVIDGLIKNKNPSKWKFIDHAAFLNKKRKLGMNKGRLQKINTMQKMDFDNTLKNLIDNNCYIDSYKVDGLQKDLSVAYCIRNRGAHDLSASSILWSKFFDIEESLFNVLFWVVDDLYS